jgi:hypothetical protein
MREDRACTHAPHSPPPRFTKERLIFYYYYYYFIFIMSCWGLKNIKMAPLVDFPRIQS